MRVGFTQRMKVRWMGVRGRKGDRWLLGDVGRRSVSGGKEEAAGFDYRRRIMSSSALQRTVWRDVSVPDNLITSQHSTPSCATVSRALPRLCWHLINHLSFRPPSLPSPFGIQSSHAVRHPLTDVSSDETLAYRYMIFRALDRQHSRFRHVIVIVCVYTYVKIYSANTFVWNNVQVKKMKNKTYDDDSYQRYQIKYIEKVISNNLRAYAHFAQKQIYAEYVKYAVTRRNPFS